MRDDYDVFLDTYEPSRQLRHATLDAYLNDPVMRQRLLDGGDDPEAIARTAWGPGTKVMDAEESIARLADFFEDVQPKWAEHFHDLVLSNGFPEEKLEQIEEAFRTDWIDGLSRRQSSDTMMALKASIRDHDRERFKARAGRYVLNSVPDDVDALLTPGQVRILFEANSNLLQAFIPDYQDQFDDLNFAGVGNLYVRRGVHMPQPTDLIRRELHYLSSYSLSLGPVEQFARTWTKATLTTGVPMIFSAPLPAVQERVVAFAPFIARMDLSQLELVVAPPVDETPLAPEGEFGGIHEYAFT